MTRFGRFRDSRLGRVGIRASKKVGRSGSLLFQLYSREFGNREEYSKFERFKGSKSRGFN